MSLKYSFLSAALAVALTSSASAALIAYEGFDYTEANDTALTGLSGGIGWTEAYPSVTSSGGTYSIADGLSFTGIPSSGKSAQRTASATLTGNGRNWATSLTAGTYWYSFLMKPTATDTTVGRGTFGLLQNGSGSDNQNGYGIRIDNSGTGLTATLTIQSQSPSQAGGGSISFPNGYNSTYLIIGKLVVTTPTNVANSVWVYKEGTAVPADETALGAAMTTVSNTVTVAPNPALYGRAFGGTAPTFFDEVRVGTAYIDVITAVASGIAPSIVAQPTSVSFFTGQNASLSVGVTGTPPFTYEWRKLAGAVPAGTDEIVGTSSSLSFNPASPANTANYYVIVSNGTEPAVTSASATLTVIDPTPASITTQPSSATVNAGATASLTVVAAGNPAPTYQWRKITGLDPAVNFTAVGTGATLNIADTDFLAEGDYYCVVSYSVPGVSGTSTTTPTNTVTVTALIDPSEGDTDNDGMADSLEKYLRNLGFAVGVSNTAKVQSLINSGYTVSFTGTPTVSEVNELALTPTTVTRLSSGEIELSFGLKEAATPTSTFTTKALTTGDVSVSDGKIILSVGDGLGDTDFYRLSTETK